MKRQKYTLVGVDGNAFAVMGYVMKAMRNEKISQEEISKYYKDATSKDYNYLLQVSCEMIDRCNGNN